MAAPDKLPPSDFERDQADMAWWYLYRPIALGPDGRTQPDHVVPIRFQPAGRSSGRFAAVDRERQALGSSDDLRLTSSDELRLAPALSAPCRAALAEVRGVFTVIAPAGALPSDDELEQFHGPYSRARLTQAMKAAHAAHAARTRSAWTRLFGGPALTNQQVDLLIARAHARR